jgi:hypothetical protein
MRIQSYFRVQLKPIGFCSGSSVFSVLNGLNFMCCLYEQQIWKGQINLYT